MRALPVLLIGLLFAPAATAALPLVPGDATEAVAWHYRDNAATEHFCSSTDPLTGVISTDLTSSLEHAEVGGGVTRYALHLDAIVGDAACPEVDVDFDSSAAWPTSTDTENQGSFSTDCGATGHIYLYWHSDGVLVSMVWDDVPGACALGIPSGTTVLFGVYTLHPQPTLVCPPVLVGCTGAAEYGWPEARGCPEQHFVVGVVGVGLVQGNHGCDWSGSGEEYAFVGNGVVGIRATHSSCTIEANYLLGAATAPCPAEVGGALMGIDWEGILP